MKKILLASTALVLSAGVAAAEVKLSGDGWMGITYTGANVAPAQKTAFKSRARVTFTLSGETDGGLAFGGSFRADNAGGAGAGTDGSVFISGDFGKLSMGDVDSALNATLFRTRHLGVLEHHGGARTADQGHLAASRPAALYEYTMDGLKVAVSAGQIGSKEFSVGVQYKMDGFGVGLGYYSNNVVAADIIAPALTAVKRAIALSAEGTFDTISVRASYVRKDNANGANVVVDKTTDLGLDVRATFDATTIGLNAVRSKTGAAAAVTTIGLGATYDLGGGATFGGAISKATASKARADIGISFKF